MLRKEVWTDLNGSRDRFTPEQRSSVMSNILAKDTKPEVKVRSTLHRLGYRFRLHGSSLPGKPDIVLKRYKTVIFVHGCFWHRHDCKKGSSLPKTNALFWKEKLNRNRERDQETRILLERLGWRVVVVWECQVPNEEDLVRHLVKSLASDHA